MSHKITDRQRQRIGKDIAYKARREEQKAIRKNKQRRQPVKSNRRKDWLPNNFDLLESSDEWDDLQMSERVMPRGETERRRANAAFASQTVIDEDADPPPTDDANCPTGRVVEASRGLYRVQIGGRTLLCGLRGSLSAAATGFTNAAAVGDYVTIHEDGVGGGVIESVLPRRSLLARPDVFSPHNQQVIVANVDQLLVVSAWREPHLWLELIDRYLIVAERNHLEAILCVNKIDLLTDADDLDVTLRPYRQLGVPIVITSATDGVGIEALRALLAARTTVLAGLSGVGKSSLISAVEPGLKLRTGDINTAYQEGRHTTTAATWLPLANGGAVVDTPGIREFGLSGLHPAELIAFMPDLADHAADCRFADCMHLDEPDCAVRAAVESGHVAASRHASYRKILASL